MADKTSKGGNIVSTVREIVEPIAESLGLTIWDVRFVKEGADHYLRIFVEKDGGVSIDDCVDLSHAIDAPLDEADPIDCNYCLEVSSPGVERALTRDEHFQKYIGAKIKIKLIRPLEDTGKREFSGTLDDYENGNVTMTISEGRTIVFNKKEASFIKLDDLEDF